ncbi:prepilin-type cleavage/methylation domain-containing protein [Superficieibacter electus]|uniref:Prepilin-type cleavage/methylation domain-containing protein n=1 Tax=Superficieibacter electus TaxID=2022662 RepID=A0A2P5GTB1_9ENTR|nr:prepilin peptidase-dependent protein [Superficieibacter electus]POP46320.1 prepilin-type cleavage/methylation domain-containing protein [Superficieibacter electus]POP49790.1 prepilin-type cleavage/methylation domain-containing protein [Superficieibacter electus]
MPVTQRGFSLPETLIAMAISSLLLLGASRFLPGLQRAALQQTRHQALDDELWQRVYTVAKHLQRAGYCRGKCAGEPLIINPQSNCVLVKWDANSNGKWDDTTPVSSDSTGFRLQNGILETLRGAASCHDKSWDKMTDPQMMRVTRFDVVRDNSAGFAPELTITLAAESISRPPQRSTAVYSITGYNL